MLFKAITQKRKVTGDVCEGPTREDSWSRYSKPVDDLSVYRCTFKGDAVELQFPYFDWGDSPL